MSFSDVKKFLKRYSPEIGLGGTIVSLILTNFLTAKATVKSVRMVDAAEAEKGEPLTKKEVVKTCWKNYIPTAIGVAGGSATAIGTYAEQNKRIMSIAKSANANAIYADKIISCQDDKIKELTNGEVDTKKVIAESNEKDISNNHVDPTEFDYCIDLTFGQKPVLCSRYDIEQEALRINNRIVKGEEFIAVSDYMYATNQKVPGYCEYIGFTSECFFNPHFELTSYNGVPMWGFTYETVNMYGDYYT